MYDYFFVEDPYMVGTLKKVAVDFVKSWRKRREKFDPTCYFDSVERIKELDKWESVRQNLEFKWADKKLGDFEVRWTIDPETFEYSIKPVPLVWFYDPWFMAFLENFVWGAPLAAGLKPSLAHGGGQFSMSAKTLMSGSLLAVIIAEKLNHPGLSTWIMDWPQSGRPFLPGHARTLRGVYARTRRILGRRVPPARPRSRAHAAGRLSRSRLRSR